MFDVFVRNLDFLTRATKAAACCTVGIAAIWRCYAQLNGMNGLYALVLCIFFAFFMIGIAAALLTQGQEQPE